MGGAGRAVAAVPPAPPASLRALGGQEAVGARHSQMLPTLPAVAKPPGRKNTRRVIDDLLPPPLLEGLVGDAVRSRPWCRARGQGRVRAPCRAAGAKVQLCLCRTRHRRRGKRVKERGFVQLCVRVRVHVGWGRGVCVSARGCVCAGVLWAVGCVCRWRGVHVQGWGVCAPVRAQTGVPVCVWSRGLDRLPVMRAVAEPSTRRCPGPAEHQHRAGSVTRAPGVPCLLRPPGLCPCNSGRRSH